MATGKATHPRNTTSAPLSLVTSQEAERIANIASDLGIEAKIQGYRVGQNWAYRVSVFVEALKPYPLLDVASNNPLNQAGVQIHLPQLWEAMNLPYDENPR